MARSLIQDTPIFSKLLLLDVIAQARVDRLPEIWTTMLQDLLREADDTLRLQAIGAVQARNETAFDDVLVRLCLDELVSTELRLSALSAAAPRLKEISPALFGLIQRQLAPEQPVLTRLAAASVASQVALNDQQLLALAEAVTVCGEVELPNVLAAFERSASGAVGRKLVQSLERSPGLEGLSVEALRQTLKSYPPEVLSDAQPLLHRLSAGRERQETRMAELEPVLVGGNPLQGKILFMGTKAACSACHAVQGVGANIGPDLSKIGNIRQPRDLLESIVFPSSSIVRSYEPYSVTTYAGRVLNGLMKRSTAEAVTLITTERKEIRVPRTEVDDIQPSRVSIMPKGLDTQLTQEQLRDLIAYLSSLK